MDIGLLERFVTKSAQDAGHTFTLDGERVTAADLGDPNCLLPLIVATIQQLDCETRGSQTNFMQLLQAADPKTHMLGLKIQHMPDMPEGAVLLFANYAVRDHLARDPQPKLGLPPVQTSRPLAATRCELRPHLNTLGLQHQPDSTRSASRMDL